MIQGTRDYEIFSAINKTETYQHKDSSMFSVLFKKVLRHNKIMEEWHFGLYFMFNNEKYWINLNTDKYSNIAKFVQNTSNKISLTLAIITYPFSFEKEVWCQTTCLLFYLDMYENKDKVISATLTPLTLELYAIEHLIDKKRTDKESPLINRSIPKEFKERFCLKVNELIHLTLWQLIRKYLELINKDTFLKVIGEFRCNKNAVTVTLTNTYMKVAEDKKRFATLDDYEGINYTWDNVKVQKLKGHSCDIALNEKNKTTIKMKLIFASIHVANQFYYLTNKNIWQNDISYNEKYDAEFDIIKNITIQEQSWVEKAEDLQLQLTNFNSKNSSILNKNSTLEKNNEEMKKELIEIKKQLQKEINEKRTLEQKVKVFEMNNSKIEENQKIINNLSKEIDKLKTEKNKEMDTNKSEQGRLQKKILYLEDRVKNKVEQRGSFSTRPDSSQAEELKKIFEQV